MVCKRADIMLFLSTASEGAKGAALVEKLSWRHFIFRRDKCDTNSRHTVYEPGSPLLRRCTKIQMSERAAFFNAGLKSV